MLHSHQGLNMGKNCFLCPPPVMDRKVKSLDGFVVFLLSYFDYSNLELFAIFIFEFDFSETYLMTSAENSISEPPNFPDPPTRLLPSALAIMPPPLQKPSYGPALILLSGNCSHSNVYDLSKDRRDLVWKTSIFSVITLAEHLFGYVSNVAS